MSQGPKSRRPRKKWNDREVSKILDFLLKETEFENPTAQIYYRKLLSISNINATWDLVRWKVRNLKITYKKAEEWLNSIDADLLESASGPAAVNARIHKLCPYFAKLKMIFGKQSHHNDNNTGGLVSLKVERMDNAEYIGTPLSASIELYEFGSDDDDSASCQTRSEPVELNLYTPTVSSTTGRVAAHQISTIGKQQQFSTGAKNSSDDGLVNGNKDRIEMEKSRFDFFKWKTEQELELKKEELQLKREELQIRRYEIEKDERMMKYEIEIKYKNKL